MKGKTNFDILHEKLPDIMKAFTQLRKEATKEGVLSATTKELMVLAVSVALRCESCIRNHTRKAIEMGISREEIQEAVGIAILMAGGPALASASIALEELEELEETSE